MNKKEREEAYGHLPEMRLCDLRFGQVVNVTCGAYHLWPPGDWLGRVVAGSIINYQRGEYPGSRNIYATHTVFSLGNLGQYFEVTSPVARYGSFLEEGLVEDKDYIVTEYIDCPEPMEGLEYFWEVFDRLNGTKYDYGQLLNILVNSILGWSPVEYLSIFDFSRKRKVCSVAARIAWMNWWEKWAVPNQLPMRRPGGKLHVEKTAPALFENQETFRIVGRLI